ncbi:MAG: hypothetical protein KGI87_12895, partial [Burkholderiales bacterium]|nr:hypothetical protein [Burkholderiales bacterium]
EHAPASDGVRKVDLREGRRFVERPRARESRPHLSLTKSAAQLLTSSVLRWARLGAIDTHRS